MMSVRRTIAATFFVLLATSFPLLADPIAVTGGSVQVEPYISSARIHFRGSGFELWTSTEDFVTTVAQGPFDFGTPVMLDGRWTPGDSRGARLIVNGYEYPELYIGFGQSGGTFITEPVTTTAVGSTPVSIPFTFAGFVNLYSAPDAWSTEAPIFTAQLTGRGTARTVLYGVAGEAGRPGYFGADILPGTDYRLEYVFGDAAAVPEPATLVLVGGGLVTLAARFRRTARTRRDA